MVDRIDAYERGISIRARKLTSTQEDHWKPLGDGLVMPAELVLESLLQAAGLLVILSTDAPRSAALPTSIQRVANLGSVVPGDVLSLEIRCDRFDDETAVFSGHVSVGDRAVLELDAAVFVLIPVEALADPVDLLPRLARLLRDPSAESPGGSADGRLSLVGS
jgi:3-hydroxyacyl-[acyl-carrier-protein] dehydratase